MNTPPLAELRDRGDHLPADTGAAAAEPGATRHAWQTLLWTSFGVFMALLDATILFVAFPNIRRSFPAVSAADLSWVLNAYNVVYAAMLVPAGRFADRVGRRRMFLLGVTVFTLGSLACGLSPTPLTLIAGRILQAMGGAMLMPSSLALILHAFPRRKWPIAVSLWTAVGALAAAVGPSAGAALIQLGGWRAAFFINLPIGILALLKSRAFLDESRDQRVHDWPDVVGIVLLVLGVSLLALDIVKSMVWGRTNLVICAGIGVLFLAWFLSRSRKVEEPALDISLFGITSFRYANAASLIFSTAFTAMFLGSVLFLTSVWGYNTTRAGLAMTPGPLVVIAVAPLAGRLAGRFGQRPLLLIGGVAFGLGFLVRAVATSPTPHYVTEWLPVVILTGIGVGLVLPSLASAAVHGLPGDRFAVGSGVNQAVRQIGSVLGVAVAVAVAGTARGPAGLTAFSRLFLILALCGFATAAVSSLIDTRPNKETRTNRSQPPRKALVPE